jgi:hypothetical protein
LQTKFSVGGWGVKKNRGTVKPGQKIKLTTILYNNKRVSGVKALDNVRVYLTVPEGLAVHKASPKATANVDTLYWWDLDLALGKKTTISVWAVVDKPYESVNPLQISSIIWPDNGNLNMCADTDAASIRSSLSLFCLFPLTFRYSFSPHFQISLLNDFVVSPPPPLPSLSSSPSCTHN